MNDRINQGKSADILAAARMLAAEEDDAEACMDDAGSSREFGALQPASAWMEAEPRHLADTRCARCSEGGMSDIDDLVDYLNIGLDPASLMDLGLTDLGLLRGLLLDLGGLVEIEYRKRREEESE